MPACGVAPSPSEGPSSSVSTSSSADDVDGFAARIGTLSVGDVERVQIRCGGHDPWTVPEGTLPELVAAVNEVRLVPGSAGHTHAPADGATYGTASNDDFFMLTLADGTTHTLHTDDGWTVVDGFEYALEGGSADDLEALGATFVEEMLGP